MSYGCNVTFGCLTLAEMKGTSGYQLLPNVTLQKVNDVLTGTPVWVHAFIPIIRSSLTDTDIPDPVFRRCARTGESC